MKRYFCTYFDRHYLPRALALYHSLQRHSPEFTLWALCMDDESLRILSELALPSFRPIGLDRFESGDTPLQEAKRGRSRIEYYFTCTPSILRYVLNRFPEVDMITYLDADLFFFSSPEIVFGEIGARSIAIIEHRFPESLRHLGINGIYNVGWISVRKDARGTGCVNWWRDRCLEWCYDRHEEGKFADQKYLDDWPARFQNVAVLRNVGANLAPWNLSNYRLSEDGGCIRVDHDALVFYHFHGLRRVRRAVYDPRLYAYGVKATRFIRRRLYSPYLGALRSAEEQVRSLAPNLSVGGAMRWSSDQTRSQPGTGALSILRGLRATPGILKALLKRDYLLVLGSRVL